MGRTSEIRLDLHAVTDKLHLFKSDLEAYYWERTGDACQRYQVGLWMRQVGERTAALEDLVMHLGCPAVVVTASTADGETLRCAVDLLDRWIDEGEAFDEVLRRVAAVLNAADTICLRAAGGKPDIAARRDAVTIERIARTRESGPGIVLARIVPNPSFPRSGGRPTRNVGS